jgi:hypothetical protein
MLTVDLSGSLSSFGPTSFGIRGCRQRERRIEEKDYIPRQGIWVASLYRKN